MTTPTQPNAQMPPLPEPAILRQPDDGELIPCGDGNEPYFWAWGAHSYDTGMRPYFSDDQMHAHAAQRCQELEAKLAAASDALKDARNWANGDKWRFDPKNKVFWQHYVDTLDAALTPSKQDGAK